MYTYMCKYTRKCVCSITQSYVTLCDPTDCSPTSLLCSWDSPGKNTGVGCPALLQGIFPTQGLKADSFTTESRGKPHLYTWASQDAVLVKNPPVIAGGIRGVNSIPGLGRSPGEGRDNPLQYSCLENPMDRGAWWATVYGVTKSWMWPSN